MLRAAAVQDSMTSPTKETENDVGKEGGTENSQYLVVACFLLFPRFFLHHVAGTWLAPAFK